VTKTNRANYRGLTRAHGDKIRSRCIEEGDCLVWTGAVTSKGYGNITFTLEGKKRWLAPHRALFILERGECAPHLEIDHLCRNRLCCLPAHMEVVTSAENTRRGDSFAAVNGRKTHCSRGHAFTEENTWRSPSTGRRKCRTCQKALRAARYRNTKSTPSVSGRAP